MVNISKFKLNFDSSEMVYFKIRETTNDAQCLNKPVPFKAYCCAIQVNAYNGCQKLEGQ